ncbi:amino acid adenylation domain-containing protein, partial [Duganella sp. CF458]|uniref:non-ribosomal peptide synthetase n=1 Tax=Duganella sp. CF458 TaxID=1884368 RepID=UPI0008E14635
LTAARFINTPEGCLYKSGDLGRWLADGSIDYLGRNDFQVKIRGFRIELGEIEAKLAACDGVREAVVLAREDQPGDKRLVAYVVPEVGVTLEAAILRATLLADLADYMVPGAYVMLEEFPLTANGKLDRKALPAPDTLDFAAQAYQAPQGAIETALAEIWAEVLGRDQVGVNDNYFAIGGDSIRSIAVVAKARERGMEIAIVDLFKAPTISALAQQLEGRAAAEGHADHNAFESISDADRALMPADVEDAYPLTMLQLGMVFHNQQEQAEGLYHELSSHCLDVPSWDEAAMRQVLAALSRKHPVLRTSFALHGFSEPLQLVHPESTVPLIVADISAASREEQDASLAAFVEAEKGESFDLEQAPLLRIFIHVRNKRQIQYTFSGHHAILDGWSVASLQTELFNNYVAQLDRGGAVIDLAPLAQTPRATSLGERKALGSPAHKAFWQGFLSGHEFSALPLADGDGGSGAVSGVALEPGLCQDIRAFAASLSVPVRTVLLSAHLRLLSMLSGKDAVTTGLVTNVRPEAVDGDKVLGLFLNTLPFHSRPGKGSWRDLVLATYRDELAVMEYRHYPYFQLHMDNGRQPLYEAVFNYINFHVYEKLAGKAEAEGFTRSYEATGYGLGVSCSDDAAHGIHVVFDARTLSPRQVEQAQASFLAIVRAMVAAPDAAQAAVSLLSQAELEHVTQTLNATAVAYPQGQLMHELFEAQAAGQPDALALAYGSTAWSYQELNRRANQVAHYLRGLGVQPDDRVALCLERGPLMVAGLLGILKAGAAYVPLDPAYPAQRLAFMLSDSAPAALLTEAAIAALLDGAGLPLVVLDGEHAAELDLQPAANPARADGMDDSHLAYVIYTSGSTGQPKGVTNHHRGLCNLVHAQTALYQVDASSRVLQFVSLSFDVCVSEIAMALCSGASLHLAAAGELLPGAPLVESLQRSAASHVSLPMAVLAALPQDASLPALKALIVGGEALPAPLANHWSARCRVYNSYGPTETTVCATVYCCDGVQQGAVPIGRPLANNRVYILDSHGQPVPRGVVGEIHIGGVQVARGYLNRPDLTEQRFVADPFAGEAGARMYRTGDLGRWLADGNIEFAGRNDFQVKIRGFRIELGEIESRLAACQGVREALVVAREDQPGDKRLVAYLVAEAGATLQANELRRTLAADLAEHMLPGAYVVLDAFPLTPNGKIDRARLPAAALSHRSGDYTAPSGATETALCTLWGRLLGLQQVGIHDNFFELGGHSLLIVKMHSELSAAYPGRLAIADYFKYTTVAKLAGYLDAETAAASRVPDGIARAAARRDRLAAQKGKRLQRNQ